MTRQRVVWIVALILIMQLKVHAQNEISGIDPMPLGISAAKTTNLIFPYAIKSIDRGSAEVLVQKATGVENVLQVKASIPSFAETNLTVMTADGRFYSFLLNYDGHPSLI